MDVFQYFPNYSNINATNACLDTQALTQLRLHYSLKYKPDPYCLKYKSNQSSLIVSHINTTLCCRGKYQPDQSMLIYQSINPSNASLKTQVLTRQMLTLRFMYKLDQRLTVDSSPNLINSCLFTEALTRAMLA